MTAQDCETLVALIKQLLDEEEQNLHYMIARTLNALSAEVQLLAERKQRQSITANGSR